MTRKDDIRKTNQTFQLSKAFHNRIILHYNVIHYNTSYHAKKLKIELQAIKTKQTQNLSVKKVVS